MGDQDHMSTGHEPEVLGAGNDAAPRLAERWSALPRTARRALVGCAALTLLAAASLYAVSAPPGPPQPEPSPLPTALPARPMPYPAQVTTISFAALRPPTRDDARAFRIELHATTSADAPVTIDNVTQGYEALRVDLDPPGPYTLAPLRPVTLFIRVEVLSCRDLPLGARMPFLDITLRNKRAEQVLSFIPGERYARSLTRQLRTLCGLPEPSTTPST